MARLELCRRNDLDVSGDYAVISGLFAEEYASRLNSSPTSVFASNDLIATGVTTAAMKGNFVALDNISVAGFDDNSTATMTWSRLNTVRQPISEMFK